MGGGVIKTWNDRWFELKSSALHYYKEEGGKYISTILLPGNNLYVYTNEGNNGGSNLKYLFEVCPGQDQKRMTSNHESYLLCANTQHEMENWVKAIRRVILSPFGGGIFGQRLDDTMRYDTRLDTKE